MLFRSPKGADGKPLVSRQADPQRVVFEADLDLPKEFFSKVKKTDLMIWDLKTTAGEVVAAQIIPVPSFPHKITISAKQLFQPIPEGARLLFGARIVRLGDEGKPPEKGQLQVLIGANEGASPVVENKAVNAKLLDKFMKKLRITVPEEIRVGGKARAEFSPAIM